MEEIIKEYKELMLGGVSVASYMGVFTFGTIALLLSLYGHSRKRDKFSGRTPEKFSWLFLIKDNLKRIVPTFLLMYVFARFFFEFFNKELSMFGALGIGFTISFGFDKVMQYIKNKTSLLDMPTKKNDETK